MIGTFCSPVSPSNTHQPALNPPIDKRNHLLGASEQLAWCLLIPGYKRQKAVCIMPVHETNGTEAT
ncbi:hypothetical protein IE4803_PB00454 (plasmid) [Rhizobium etli bv. phaseoli str. IE4803]|nr:hypothetical protein IE4803_PB00454 [Rhizobium etli bv. phaseoli str. IE4803]